MSGESFGDDERLIEQDLFKLEKKMIRKYKAFSKIVPKPVRIVETEDYHGEALGKEIRISRNFLIKKPSQKEIEDLLKHELIHLRYPEYGHSIEFLTLAKKLRL